MVGTREDDEDDKNERTEKMFTTALLGVGICFWNNRLSVRLGAVERIPKK